MKNNRNKGNKGKGGTKVDTTVKFACPVCGEGLKSIATAVDLGDGPAHFDCVLRELTKKEDLKQGEKIVYIGSGRFGVINNKKNESGVPFTLLKEIDVETRDLDLNWRNEKKIEITLE